MDKKLLQKIKRAVLEIAPGRVVSLYVIGSFLSNEMVESSDIDLVGVMKPNFDFRQESTMNRALNKAVHTRHKIDLGTMSYNELSGGRRKGSLMKYIELPIFLNFLKRARLIYGKRINFNNFPIKPASPETELKYHITMFNECKDGFRKRNRIRATFPDVKADFYFKDFIKIVFYIANLEFRLTRKLKPKRSYKSVLEAFAMDKKHITHYSIRLRCKKTIRSKERQTWLNLADAYVEHLSASLPRIVGSA